MYQVRTDLINEKKFIAGFAHSFHWFNFPRKVQNTPSSNIQKYSTNAEDRDKLWSQIIIYKLQTGIYYSPMHAIQ